jgi:hypothetical protein
VRFYTDLIFTLAYPSQVRKSFTMGHTFLLVALIHRKTSVLPLLHSKVDEIRLVGEGFATSVSPVVVVVVAAILVSVLVVISIIVAVVVIVSVPISSIIVVIILFPLLSSISPITLRLRLTSTSSTPISIRRRLTRLELVVATPLRRT